MILPLLAALSLTTHAVELTLKQPADLEWKVSGTLPQGVATHDYSLVYEDPATHGITTLVRFSKGYELPPHIHTHDETLIVLKGKLSVTIEGKTTTLGPGGYAVIPAGLVHAFKAGGWSGCEMVVSFAGPMDFKPGGSPAEKKP
jgi:quercetin dioxygenase-like cupin family protein